MTVYTATFLLAFFLFAAIVYFLPLYQLRAQVDNSLVEIAEAIRQGEIVLEEENALLAPRDADQTTLALQLTFILAATADGQVVATSANLADFKGVLDPKQFGATKRFSDVSRDNVSLRVLTMPLYDEQGVLVGYLQVGRMFDTYRSLNRFLAFALFIGLAGATMGLFVAVLVTPSSFVPLEDIANVARQVTHADDLSLRVPYADRKDETGVLARSFNQLLARLENLFQTQQRLLADVSHELRTPLTTIRGNADLMRRMGEADEESLKVIQEEADRMTRLVGDLLLLARADAGSLPLERKKLELDTLFFELYRQVTLQNTAVTVRVTEIDQVAVMGDPDRIKQLLWNLIGNGLKYTPPGGSLFLSLSKTEEWAIIEVKDTGIGIPPQSLPHIFDRFYRVDKARTRHQGGSGLGLSIARWVAEAHGGKIEVSSEVGVGSTFTLWLPAIREPTPPHEDNKEDSAKLEATRPGLRVLSSPFRR